MRQARSPSRALGQAILGTALAGLVAAVTGCATSTSTPPRVAAASDLQFALADIAGQYQRDSGQVVEVIYGSSGTLARQIQDGAPFAVFLSADERFVEQLAQAGRTRGAGDLYAIGRLALFAPTGSPLVPSEGLDGLARLIERGGRPRLAIANPDHAPYGRAAEQALRTRGLWDALRPSLVLGENVSQAAQFAASGDTVGGIVAYSLALSPGLRERGTFALLPAQDHAPLRQRMVLLASADERAARFYRYLQEPAARATMVRYGFVLPD